MPSKILNQHSGIFYCSIRIFKHRSEPFKLIPNSVMGAHLHEFFFPAHKDYHGESVSTQIRLSTTRSPPTYLLTSRQRSAIALHHPVAKTVLQPPGPFGITLFGDKDHGELAPLAILSFTVYVLNGS